MSLAKVAQVTTGSLYSVTSSLRASLHLSERGTGAKSNMQTVSALAHARET